MTSTGAPHIEAHRAEAGTLLTAGQRARWTLGEMVGRSTAMERLFLQMRYLAKHLRVGLVEGEAGTGKRLAAETLGWLAHNRASTFPANTDGPSAPDAPCVAVEDASAFLARFVSQSQLEAWLETSGCQLLYLQNVDRLHAREQQALLHLCAWMLDRSGARRGFGSDPDGSGASPLPVALLLGSQTDLRTLVMQQTFRNDLYQKIAAVRLELPPLRDRAEDIPLLVDQFLRQATTASAEPGGQHQIPAISLQALAALQASPWPGNLTVLRRAVEQAVSQAGNGTLAVEHFPDLPTADASLPGARRAHPQPDVAGAEAGAGPRRESPNTATLLRWPPAHPLALKKATGVSSQAIPRCEAIISIPVEPGSGYGSQPGDGGSPTLSIAVSPAAVSADGAILAEDANLDRAILRHIGLVLDQCRGNKLRASRLLGISRSTLYRLIEADAQAVGFSTTSEIR